MRTRVSEKVTLKLQSKGLLRVGDKEKTVIPACIDAVMCNGPEVKNDLIRSPLLLKGSKRESAGR